MNVRSRGGFTLVEVVLAILIISGIMTVLLYFYQRAGEVRQKALEEAQFLSDSRMFLDQLTAELRTARVVEDQFIGFEGTSNSITFICTAMPQMARWIASTNEPLTLPPATDLKRVQYSLLGGTNLSVVRGLDRVEEILLGSAFTAGTNATEFIDHAELTKKTGEVEAPLPSTNIVGSFRAPLTVRIQFLAFRYWDGKDWVESWTGLDLPGGVEITLGHESMPAEATEVYPFEIMRRVVYLPNSAPAENRIISPLEPEVTL